MGHPEAPGFLQAPPNEAAAPGWSCPPAGPPAVSMSHLSPVKARQGFPEPVGSGPDSFARLTRSHLVWPCHPVLLSSALPAPTLAFFSVQKCHVLMVWHSQNALPACFLLLPLLCQVSSGTALPWPPVFILVACPSSKLPGTPAFPEPTSSLSLRSLESRRGNPQVLIHSIHSPCNKCLLSTYYNSAARAEPGLTASLGPGVPGTGGAWLVKGSCYLEKCYGNVKVTCLPSALRAPTRLGP